MDRRTPPEPDAHPSNSRSKPLISAPAQVKRERTSDLLGGEKFS
jgi:hypothetical protein